MKIKNIDKLYKYFEYFNILLDFFIDMLDCRNIQHPYDIEV